MKKIVVISAVWCPSCLVLAKNLKKIKNNYKDIGFVKYDYDFDEEEVKKYNVGKILPVLIKENGDRLIGEKSYEEVEAFINE